MKITLKELHELYTDEHVDRVELTFRFGDASLRDKRTVVYARNNNGDGECGPLEFHHVDCPDTDTLTDDQIRRINEAREKSKSVLTDRGFDISD